MRFPDRRLFALIAAGLATAALLGPAAAATPEPVTLSHVARLKELQQRRLLEEPVERLQERLEIMRELRRFGLVNPVGHRIRPATQTDTRAAALDRTSAARTAAPLGLTAIAANHRMNNPAGDAAGSGQSEISIAVDGVNMVAAWNDGQGFVSGGSTQGFAFSTDGGLTWTDGGSPPSTNVGTWSSDPVVVVNEKTHAFYFSALCDIDASNNGVGVVKGTFSGGGFAWGTPRLATSSLNSAALFDKEWIAVDSLSGNLYVSYARFQVGFGGAITSNRIDVVRSTNDGVSWSAPINLSSAPDAGRVQGVRLAVGPGPTSVLYAVWAAIGNDATGLDYFRMRRSTTAGASFGAEVTAASYFSNFGNGSPGFNRPLGITFPALAVDKTSGLNRGRVYLAWNESVNFYFDSLGTTGAKSEVEPNNAQNNATPFTPGQVVRGITSIPTDLDYFKFSMTAGQTVIFYEDSLTSTHEASMRVFCPDGVTELAFTETGLGGTALIVWSAPTTGDYYLRIASLQQNTTGRYVIETGLYHDQGDPSRDQRDVFVKPSPDGQTWLLPAVLVNDDPVGHDNWLPEVGVAGNGKPYVGWYDFRDSDPCGGSSHVYLARSDDGGIGWSTGSPVTTTATNWTFVDTNIQPNQGDYISVFPNNDAVYVAWTDGRDGDPNVYMGAVPLGYTATQVSLSSATATSESVTLEWYAPGQPGLEARVERRIEDGGWDALESIRADGTGALRYVDRDVAPGRHQSYRLVVGAAGSEERLGEVTVEIPAAGPLALAIAGVRPNPTHGPIAVTLTLADDQPATIELLDVTGRRVAERAIASPAPGRRVEDLSRAAPLPAGVYVVRLTQSGRVATARITVLR